jgi:hypothetical protein
MFNTLWQSFPIQFDHQTLSQLKTFGGTLNKILIHDAHINHTNNEAKDKPSKDFSIAMGPEQVTRAKTLQDILC